jgi:hypothetical protein
VALPDIQWLAAALGNSVLFYIVLCFHVFVACVAIRLFRVPSRELEFGLFAAAVGLHLGILCGAAPCSWSSREERELRTEFESPDGSAR